MRALLPHQLRRGALCGLMWLLLSSTAGAAAVRLQLIGLEGELQKNVQARLSTISPDEVNTDSRFRARVDESIRQGLRALGYYEPLIDFELIPAEGRGSPVLNVTVNPGEPVKIAGSRIALRGQAQQDDDYQALIRTRRPVVGSVLNHGEYEDFKTELNTLSMRKGYFDGHFKQHRLSLMQSTRQAWWDIDYDSGERYRFGRVAFQGSQIRADYLQNLVPFQEGDAYSAERLGEFNRRLSATGWFNSVVVAPDLASGRQHHQLALDAVVTPRTRNNVETGVGYATDVGPRLKTTWNKPWVNSYGHSLTSSLSVSAPEQQLDWSYKIPLLKNPLEHYYLVQGGFKREDLNDTQSDSTSFTLARYWELSSGWQRALKLRWALDHFTQANVTHTTMLLYPGISVNRTRQRGGLMPDWGDTQRYSIDVSNTLWGSDIDFAVFQAQNAWIRTIEQKHRFVARANLGWIETSQFSRVPPSLRFFAGGDRSIRGYKYKSISPRDSDGKLTGATKLATGSLEYQYNLSGKWWGAVFVDSGEAINDLMQTHVKTGAGVGVRWASPVGPVKLDIARPVGDSDKRGVQFYIGLGPEL
ncbi:autotransporter assembly complex protein TamA [Dickeya lacustris]|uniref:autotransporter assembly complex protein TamA n=1 Tax=Dickeya lacustris TaxID=2259638 RepID=UPI000F656881|nr:autotransporter assembly complex family protein [Dickeya lacustris]